MQTPREVFLTQVEGAGADPAVAGLREAIRNAKIEALDQARNLDESALQKIMPDLYQHVLTTEVQLAGHVGLGTAVALMLHDEHEAGVSLSTFSREVRQQMTDMAVELKKRRTSRIARVISELEAQRLAWRHSHEFMSWLAFRRGDDRYPADDRLARLEAFKVGERLLQTRDAIIAILGVWLAGAVEGCDRFLLANRWRLAPSHEHAVERHIWPLLSMQPAATVRMEQARFEFDAMAESGADKPQLETQRQKLRTLLRDQLAAALDHLPETALAGAF